MTRPLSHAPRVSVLMPVFNGGAYLQDAAQSILSQTFDDFELIVIDDGSTDGSSRVLEKLQARDARIRLSSRPNRGLVATLNEMIAMARGELLARMDADDIAYPNRFARQVEFLDAHPEVVAVGSRALFIDAEGLPLMEAMDHFSHEQIERALMTPQLGMVHPSVMIRSPACRAVGGYRAEYKHAEDLDFFLRLSELGRLANIPEPLLQYRTYPSSVSARHMEEQWQSARRAVEDALVRRGVNPATVQIAGLPGARIETAGELHRKWSWWALGSGHLRTARKHARLALVAEPLSLLNHRLLACVIRDSLKGMR
jgi:glycosyltransferase involved in cell wall biosynthesis